MANPFAWQPVDSQRAAALFLLALSHPLDTRHQTGFDPAKKSVTLQSKWEQQHLHQPWDMCPVAYKDVVGQADCRPFSVSEGKLQAQTGIAVEIIFLF